MRHGSGASLAGYVEVDARYVAAATGAWSAATAAAVAATSSSRVSSMSKRTSSFARAAWRGLAALLRRRLPAIFGGMGYTLHDMVTAYAEGAVRDASSNYGITLDFSPDSVERVEEILARLAPYRPGFWKRLTGRSVEMQTKAYGYYVGEVVRRNLGGEWAVVGPFGQPAGMALTKGDCTVWPLAKVMKRLSGEDGENVWDYFRILRSEMWPRDDEASTAASEPGSSVPRDASS
jgi:hypothetical protein